MRNNKDPIIVIKELVSMGLEEEDATKLVDNLLKESPVESYCKERNEENKSILGAIKLIVYFIMGIGFIYKGLDYLATGYVMFYLGITLLVCGVALIIISIVLY